jgi:transcriptional regulator with XRE-family HTH domain
MKLDIKLLGKRIRTERTNRGLTQDNLAEAVGVSSPYIGQIERGERGVSLETLINICNYFHETADYLLGEHYTWKDVDYYKTQWAKLMNNVPFDFQQEYIQKIVKTMVDNMEEFQEKLIETAQG